jgi:rRNA-processing protein FCF1
MQKVVLDTNALLIPGRDKIDIFGEITSLVGSCEVIVPSFIVDELNRLAAGKGKTAEYAKVGLGLLSRTKIAQKNLTKAVDDALIDFAKEQEASVFTNDRELKQKLDAAGVPVIFWRQRRYAQK